MGGADFSYDDVIDRVNHNTSACIVLLLCLFDATVVCVQITSRVLYADDVWKKLIDGDCFLRQSRALILQSVSYAVWTGMYALVNRCALTSKPPPK